jgi:hypothetical protein
LMSINLLQIAVYMPAARRQTVGRSSSVHSEKVSRQWMEWYYSKAR